MDLCCKIFVNAKLSGDQLISWLLESFPGDIDGRTLITPLFEMDVISNEDFDKDKLDDFVFYPFYLEIDASDEAEEVDYISETGNLLRVLRSSDYAAVAACDFEEQLPEQE
ncbi:hypothetical protein ACJJIF_18230 [Microbulbifer sp. SSSA002]|uniref:hypothetical protein n=1 Tax=Microbulbifer sp. SSSA002 TaxID=3243376 RepID=UPI004039623A